MPSTRLIAAAERLQPGGGVEGPGERPVQGRCLRGGLGAEPGEVLVDEVGLLVAVLLEVVAVLLEVGLRGVVLGGVEQWLGCPRPFGQAVARLPWTRPSR